jgi:hypothetical protein
MARIPKVLHEPIYNDVCLIGTTLADGFVQITMRGSTMAFDDEHLALWERGKGTTTASLVDGTPVTVFFRSSDLRKDGTLPKAGVARFYGHAAIHKSGPIYEEVWDKLHPYEKERDPEMKGFAVLIKVERAEDFDGDPLDLD